MVANFKNKDSWFFDSLCQNNNQKLAHADYIYHKNQKSKFSKKDLPILKNDITNYLEPQKPVRYCSNMKSGLSA